MSIRRSPAETARRSPAQRRIVGLTVTILILVFTAAAPTPAGAIGRSPRDPIPFDVASGAIQLTVSGGEVWLSTRFEPSSTLSHVALETRGSLDTDIAVFASRSEALGDEPFADDDDSGQGANAAVQVPLGFPSPYLVRVRADRAGSITVRAELLRAATERCDWPAGCPLAVAAQDEPTAREMLELLRSVRSEILVLTSAGRDLIDLYWKLGRDLVPDLLTDPHFRQRSYEGVTALLPLAHEALAAVAGTGGGGRVAFSWNDYERLQGLLGLLLPRLSPQLAAELRGRWEEYDLSRLVGLPVAKALTATGLLPTESTRHTVIAKLWTEPPQQSEEGALRPRTGDVALDARLAAAGVEAIRQVHRDTPGRRVAGLTRTVAFDVEGLAAARDLAEEIASYPGVEWAEVAATMYALAGDRTDPFRGDLWGLDAVRAPAAWSLTRGTCATRVAVVDTGLRPGLADLEGRVLHRLGYDFVDDDPDPQDGHGHGTHVAGTIASAVDNAISIGGVAPDTCVFAVKVLSDDGSGSAEGVAAGIVHAVDSGARVINMSLGCDCDTEQAIEEALRYAAENDVVVIAAAGNDGQDELYYPASSPRTIAVAALDEDQDRASFSNYGRGLDLSAPGVDVVSLFRDGESCTGSGTSMAAPHASGVAALVHSFNPALDREEVRDILRTTAIDLGPRGYDREYGAGLVDAFEATAAAGAAGPFLTSDELPGYRFKVRITGGDRAIPGRAEPDCVGETLCVGGALAGRSELFARIIGPRPNGFLWVNLVRFTTSRVEVWVERISTGEINYYDLPALPPTDTELTGLVDKRAFPEDGSAAGTPTQRVRARPLGAPGLGPVASTDVAAAGPRFLDRADPRPFTSGAFPGFRFRVRIFAGGVEQPAQVESDCMAETVCVRGSLPGRSELFLRIIGPRPNGFLWVNLVRFTTSRVEVEIEQRATGAERTYVLEQVPPGSDTLPGRVDREAFVP